MKIKPAAERLTDKVLIPLTTRTRQRVEAVAAQERVSMAEIGRRALAQYLKQQANGAER